MQDGKYVILVIDDNADFREAVRLILEANDYLMVEASSAEQGLKKYKAETPDLIIVDLMMEEVDAGANFAKELKLLNNTAPIYLLSGAGDSMASSTDYNDLGFNGVFQKPINAQRLLGVLKAKLPEA
ncbi:MAG: response regulator [Candidatus Omnitrophica bacterium]|nr:response regulator [Candidatus Omnitrophota bacterium]